MSFFISSQINSVFVILADKKSPEDQLQDLFFFMEYPPYCPTVNCIALPPETLSV
jgi:hypothetical protein